MSRDCLEQFVSDCTAKFIPWSLILVLFTLMVIVLVFAGAKAEPVPRHIVHVFTGITFGVIGVWLIGLFYQHVKKKMRAEIRSPVFPSDRNTFGQAQVLEKQQQQQQQREDERRNALEVQAQPPQQQYTSQQQQQPQSRTGYGPRYDLEQQATRQRQPDNDPRPQSPDRQRHVPRTAGPRQMPHHGTRAPSRGRQLPGPCDARTNLDRPSSSIQQTPEHMIGTSRSRTRAASRPARHPASRSRRRDKRRSQSESTVASPTPPGGFDYRHPRSRTRDRRDDDAELFMTVPRARRNDVESLRDSVGPASPGAASMDTEERMAITVSYTMPTQRPREVETSRAQQLTSLKPHPLRVPKRSGAQPSAIDELPSQRGLPQPSTSRAGGGHDNAGPSRVAETEAWEARTESPVLPHRVPDQQQPQPQPAQTDVGDPPRRQPALTFDEMDVGSGREPLRNAWLTKATEGFKSALRPSKNGSSLASSRD
ncbi:hypothetical protein CSOJ01_02503 [Colletotrichum sojae]|uniref:Uncharacterized protein n=1 Tax=Colletotrichum sojae TaxID=2175907 RepID=A0A8H6N2P1_9PEZI|nr:hypothetical protein CSOJ01_02503 [Colletotrichum sojae]